MFFSKVNFSKTGRREVPGSFLGRVCRPSRREFSVVFSETHVKTGYDPLERPPRGIGSPKGNLPQALVAHADNWPYPYNQSTKFLFAVLFFNVKTFKVTSMFFFSF